MPDDDASCGSKGAKWPWELRMQEIREVYE
jgi:hypothetical protein